jgi:hypothetical protein
MRAKLAFCACALVLVGASCDMTDDPTAAATIAPDLGPDEFALSGVVVDAKDGAKPAGGMPDDEDGLLPEATGGIAIRPEGAVDEAGLEGCTQTSDAFVTYYTSQTETGDLRDDDGWPVNLEGREVKVEGVRHDRGEGSIPVTEDVSGTCVLVLDRIEELEAEAEPSVDNTSGGAGGGGTVGDADASPGASPSPVWIFEDPKDTKFPKHEDTDPIFEGTPSPDPCEGAKACEQHRRTGQEPQP